MTILDCFSGLRNCPSWFLFGLKKDIELTLTTGVDKLGLFASAGVWTDECAHYSAIVSCNTKTEENLKNLQQFIGE